MPSRESSHLPLEMPPNEVASSMLERYRDSLILYIGGKLGSDRESLVADIWQEVAIAVHRQDFETTTVEDPLNWLRRIASHKIADHWRTTLRGRMADTRWLNHQGEAGHRCPFEWVLLQSRRETVRGVLDCLGEEERRLLREKYLEGHTIAEMARTSGVTEKTIEHRLAQARNSFREILSKES